MPEINLSQNPLKAFSPTDWTPSTPGFASGPGGCFRFLALWLALLAVHGVPASWILRFPPGSGERKAPNPIR